VHDKTKHCQIEPLAQRTNQGRKVLFLNEMCRAISLRKVLFLNEMCRAISLEGPPIMMYAHTSVNSLMVHLLIVVYLFCKINDI